MLWQRIRGFVRHKFTLIAVAGASIVVGLGLAAGYGSVIDYTSSLNFCAHTCHEMESTVYQEYTHSKHFKNQHGVVVVCADCHVPHHNWPATFVTKFFASFELWNHFIDREYITERFEARRLELAKKVWAKFEATNARECKSCHQFANMIVEEQNPSARAMHTEAMKTDENCLDCHKGLTHKIMVDTAQAAPANTVVAAAQAPAAPGQEVYAQSCAACHNNLDPKLGDKAAWEPRLKQGDDALVVAVINGKGPMPPRAGKPDLSDTDIKAAVEYIESKVK
jgi:cytochrome c-type protein NapC